MRLRTTCPYRILGLTSSPRTLRVTHGAIRCCFITRRNCGLVGRLNLDTCIVKTHMTFSPRVLVSGVECRTRATKGGFLVASKRRYLRGDTVVRTMRSVVLRAMSSILCLFPS